jgi:hypothetical protein
MSYRLVIPTRDMAHFSLIEHGARSACAERREKVEEGKLTHPAQLSRVPMQIIRFINPISRYKNHNGGRK